MEWYGAVTCRVCFKFEAVEEAEGVDWLILVFNDNKIQKNVNEIV